MLLWWGVYSAAEKHCTLHCWSLPFCTPLHHSESFLHLCKMRCVQDVWEVFRDWHHKIYIIKYNIIWLYINYTTHPTNTWHVSPFELTLEDSNTFSRLHALLEGLVQDLPHLGHPEPFRSSMCPNLQGEERGTTGNPSETVQVTPKFAPASYVILGQELSDAQGTVRSDELSCQNSRLFSYTEPANTSQSFCKCAGPPRVKRKIRTGTL